MFLGGCYHESWTYRAVPNVIVTRPYEPGSEGPLVLVSMSEASTATVVERPDPAKRIDALLPGQIAMMDREMADKLSRKSEAESRIQKLRAEGLTDHHPRIMEARLDADEASKAVDEYAQSFRDKARGNVAVVGGNLAPAPPEKHVPQTVLVASVRRDFGSYDRSVGRTIVLFIDGDPKPGEYWLTADNSVLISFSAFSAPARTRVGLIGSVKILEVDGNRITADVAIQETTEADSTLWVERPYDANNWQAPWRITGRRTFVVTDQEDPILRTAKVEWNHAGSK